MAISHIASNTQDSGAALSLTFTVPASTTTDDLILVMVKQSENTTQRIWDDDGGGGNGYTRLVYNRTTSGRDQETAIYYKYATSGSEANPTFTWASGVTSEPMSGIMEIYRGCETNLPPKVTQNLGTNDANPPNATADDIDFDDSWVVCFHAATHDDISTVAAPTGFTLRSQIWNGTSNDHRNLFSADINNRDVSDNPYTPPDWGHSVLNTTPEYHCYTVVLTESQPILITGGTATDDFNWGDQNLTITGKGFGATQGGGKVEYWDDTSGTTKTVQTIDSWSDTSIQIDTSQGSLPNDTVVYLVVTNNSSQESQKFPVGVGLLPYNNVLANLNPDHKWTMQNVTTDSGDEGGSPINNSGSTGTPVFVSTEKLADGDTHSLQLNSVTDRSEFNDSNFINTSARSERTMGGWIQLGGIQHSLSCLYEEGGGVNNIAFLNGYGNKLLASYADTADDNAQAFADFALAADRPYHIMFRFSHVEATKEFRLYIDGEEQTVTDGNPLTSGDLDSHSGDAGFGDPDGNLEVGGTDVAFDGQTECYYSHWASWTRPLNKTTEIRDVCFRRGAAPKDTLASGTEAAMQTALEALDETRTDWPLSLRVLAKTSGGNFELTLEDSSGNPWTFEDRITSHVEYRGGDTLTLVRPPGCNLDAAKCWSASGGTITVVDDVAVTVTVRDIDDSSVIQGARVLLEEDPGGTDILSGTTDVSGQITTNYRFSSSQAVTGKVRKGTASTYYKESPISATITSDGLDLTIFMIKDE